MDKRIYFSITTPGVQHDAINALIELYLVRKYGRLEAYPWRRGTDFRKEWVKLRLMLKYLFKVFKIPPEELACLFFYFMPHNSTMKIIDIFNSFVMESYNVN